MYGFLWCSKLSYQWYFSLSVNIIETSAFKYLFPKFVHNRAIFKSAIHHLPHQFCKFVINDNISIINNIPFSFFFFFSKATILSPLNASQVLEESVFMKVLFHWIRFTTSGTHFVDVLHLPTGTHWFGLTTCIRSPD